VSGETGVPLRTGALVGERLYEPLFFLCRGDRALRKRAVYCFRMRAKVILGAARGHQPAGTQRWSSALTDAPLSPLGRAVAPILRDGSPLDQECRIGQLRPAGSDSSRTVAQHDRSWVQSGPLRTSGVGASRLTFAAICQEVPRNRREGLNRRPADNIPHDSRTALTTLNKAGSYSSL
jgi:hypothetical protein